VNETIKKVKGIISKYNMIRPGDRVVVAVSGGPDSVCLLDILHELKDDLRIKLFVAHFDHGLRPGEDDAETRFVGSLAASLSLPAETKKAPPGIGSGEGPLEEKARHARYRFFEEVKEKFSAQKIAVGHSLNDQAETVLMRLLRGSGLSGLAGIPPCRDNKVIRPLIEMTREEIMAYVKKKNLNYVTDPSNSETRFLRNKIRLEFLPRFKEIQPRIIERLGQTAEIMRRDDEWMEAETENWVKRTAEIGADNKVIFPLSLFIPLPEALKYRVIRYALRETGGTLRRISLRHIEAINSVANGDKPQTRINLPNGLIIKRIYDVLLFKRGEERPFKAFSYTLDGPGTFRLEALESTISLEETGKVKLSDMRASPWTAFLNPDHITYPLIIRSFRSGDRFIPFGMSGHKKLKDFFMDLKIPAKERARIPILTQNDIPVWICGFRIDDRFKVTADTKKVLKVTFRR